MTDSPYSLPLLSAARLGTLPAAVETPGYDRAAVTPGIVHIGAGAFHRAHQGAVIEDCLRRGDLGLGIVAASLRSAATRDALAPQDNLYTLAIRDGQAQRLRVIGAILEVIVARDAPRRLIAALTDRRVAIASVTVTEKGYLRDGRGDLDLADPDLQHDLRSPARPKTLYGFAAAAIAARRDRGLPPLTFLSCDNLAGNGAVLRRLLLQFLAEAAPGLAAFAEDAVRCPSSMVDRIVPATRDADRAEIAARLGVRDAGPVVAEPYLSWIIEDDFGGLRPPFDTPGVQFVADVAPYERMKLRLLNGAHSLLAYAGLLRGHRTVDAAFADPGLCALVERLWTESGAGLAPGLDRVAFTRALAARFANAAIAHRLEQIASDGSEKLPLRIVAPALENLAARRGNATLYHCIACWIECLRRIGRGAAFDFSDPRRDALIAAARSPAQDAAGAVLRLIAPAMPDGRLRELQAGVGRALSRLGS